MYKRIGAKTANAGGVLGLSLLLMLSPAISAAPVTSPEASLLLAQNSISLQQAVARVKEKYGGRVLKAEPATVKGRAGYRIRVMSNGRIREFLVDASSGRLMRP